MRADLAVASDPVAAFTHRADDVAEHRFAIGMFVQRHDAVKGLVHGRTRQVIHGGVHDAEILLFAGLEVEHLGDTHARIAHQGASGLDHELALSEAARVEFGQQLRPQGVRRWWRVAVVVDTQPAAQVDVLKVNPRRFDGRHQIQHPVQRIQIGCAIRDL